MKFLKVAASVLLGAVVTAYAHPQREKQTEPPKQEKGARPQQQQAQPRQQQQREQQPQQQRSQPQPQQPQRSQQQQQPQRAQQPQPQRSQQQQQRQNTQTRNYSPPQRSAQQAQTWQQQNGWRQHGGWQGAADFRQTRSSNWEHEHRSWSQRGGYGGYFIPYDHFMLTFGFGHFFRIGIQPYIVGGYPRFRYGGYTFMMVDPWPEDWSWNWYASDEMYIGWDDGYYLFNRMHPDQAVALAVVM